MKLTHTLPKLLIALLLLTQVTLAQDQSQPQRSKDSEQIQIDEENQKVQENSKRPTQDYKPPTPEERQAMHEQIMSGVKDFHPDVDEIMDPKRFMYHYHQDTQEGNLIPEVKRFFPNETTLIFRKKYHELLLHFANGHLFFKEGHINKEHHAIATQEISQEIEDFLQYKHGNQKKFDLHNFWEDFVKGEFYEFVDEQEKEQENQDL